MVALVGQPGGGTRVCGHPGVRPGGGTECVVALGHGLGVAPECVIALGPLQTAKSLGPGATE